MPGQIDFGPNAKSEVVSERSRDVIRSLMAAAGLPRVVITSTARTPFEQARAMHANLERYGIAHQKALYASAGDQVIDVYSQAKAQNRTRDETLAMMVAEIVRIGPPRVSRHCADPAVVNVIDIAPSSIPSARKGAWEQAIAAHGEISRHFFPPDDPAYHIEIPQ